MISRVIILISAILVDLIVGEYPEKIHPVVWIGKLVEFWDKKFYGGIWRGASIIPVFLLISISTQILFLLPLCVSLPLQVYFLKSTFSIRSLAEHVYATCRGGKMRREEVAKIVSRDVSNLDDEHLASAAIESCAENLVDAIVSPLLFFAVFGLPGAFFYRCINTADAMIGYRTERYEYFGKSVAKLDDILNYIPARLTYLLAMFLSPRVLRYKKYARGKNGMYPIAAFSAILGVKLEKIGYYTIPGRKPTTKDVERSILICGCITSMALWVVITLAWWCETLGI